MNLQKAGRKKLLQIFTLSSVNLLKVIKLHIYEVIKVFCLSSFVVYAHLLYDRVDIEGLFCVFSYHNCCVLFY